MLSEFELEIPGNLDEALDILATGDGASVMPLAGGTNVLVDIRSRRNVPDRLVGISNIAELRRLDVAEDRITIGAGTTVGEILHNPDMAEWAPSLVAAARVFGGQMVRNAATVGGNICCGSPAADTVPPLLSLDAEVELTGKEGRRTMPLADFFLGYQHNQLRPGELLTSIAWNKPQINSANLFYKLGLRKGDAITVVGVAVSVAVEAGACSHARIALGAVGPTVLRARKAEEMLAGEALGEELIDAAARQAVEECSPIDDLRASAEYRRHCVHVLTRRLLTQAWEQLV